MEIMRIGPFLWIVVNERGEATMIIEDEVEAGLMHYEMQIIRRRKEKRLLEAFKKTSLVRKIRIVDGKVA